MFYPLGIPTRFWTSQKLLTGLLLGFLMNFFLVLPLNALTDFTTFTQLADGPQKDEFVLPETGEGGLQEVAAPGVIETIRSRLMQHRPQLRILSPATDETLFKTVHEQWQLVVEVNDWPLIEDAELGLGPHLVVQVDDEKLKRVTAIDGHKVAIPMHGLTPGTHRVAAYLAFPWGEALKEPDTKDQIRISFFSKTTGTQPAISAPWLTVVSPSELSMNDPLLIDSLIWNAPLQGLKEGDDNWRLKTTINGYSFFMDKQEALWIRGFKEDINIIQFELLNKFGNAIDPVFNNKVRIYRNSNSDSSLPAWMNIDLAPNDILKLVGEDQKSQKIPGTDQSGDNQSEKTKIFDDPRIADYEMIFPPE